MRTNVFLLAAVTLGFGLVTVHAQSSPEFGGYLSRLFFDNPAFTATLEYHSYSTKSGNTVTAQGKLAYLNGKTRFEMDMSNADDASLPRQDASTLAQLGMNRMIAISRPEAMVNYFIYPDMRAYVRRPIPYRGVDEAAAADYKLDATEIGAENVLGQDCVKYEVIATGPDGIPHKSTVWNATDLNKFPIKIETVQNGANVVLLFRDLKLEAPAVAQFDPPADYKPYDDFRSLMKGRAGTQQGS
jgi:hypothetical protein